MNRLLELRTRRGLALRGLTALCRVSAATLSAIERWNYMPAAVTRERIARALEVSVEEIWSSQDEG